MDKINFDFFEFFGAVLPGIPTFIMLCFISSNLPFSFEAIDSFVKTMTLSQTTVIVLISYCIGFCLHYPAYELFKPILNHIYPKRTLGYPASFNKRENELAKIRQKSQESYKLINKFMALRQMAYSMFFSFLLFLITLIIITFLKGRWNYEVWLCMSLCIIFGFLFLRRAIAFNELTQNMITEAYAIC